MRANSHKHRRGRVTGGGTSKVAASRSFGFAPTATGLPAKAKPLTTHCTPGQATDTKATQRLRGPGVCRARTFPLFWSRFFPGGLAQLVFWGLASCNERSYWTLLSSPELAKGWRASAPASGVMSTCFQRTARQSSNCRTTNGELPCILRRQYPVRHKNRQESRMWYQCGITILTSGQSRLRIEPGHKKVHEVSGVLVGG